MKPATCSECERPVRPHKQAGRPRHTCGRHCARARHIRLKAERRRWSKYSGAAVKNPLVRAELNEFRHWARTGEQSLEQLSPDVLLTQWANHRCKACR